MLLIVARLPPGDPKGSMQKAAAICGLALADVSSRLGGILPRSLLSDASAARVAELRRQLEATGFLTVACDPQAVPGDEDRVIGRRLEARPDDGGLVVLDRIEDEGGRSEGRHVLPRGALRLIQRGVRVTQTSSTQKVTEKKFSVGLTALTGGIMTRKSVERTVTQQGEQREAFLLLQRRDGRPDVILYERRMDYRFLGPGMGPASAGNLAATLDWIRARFPDAPVDDRVLRPGFVRGLPQTAAEPVDLALRVVSLAHEAESRTPPV